MLRRKIDMTRARYIASWRGRVRDRPHVGFFACFHTISLERSRFRKIATLYPCSRCLQPLGATHWPIVACSARTGADRQTADRLTSTVTLAAHARRGLITEESEHLYITCFMC